MARISGLQPEDASSILVQSIMVSYARSLGVKGLYTALPRFCSYRLMDRIAGSQPADRGSIPLRSING